ncbi:MAG: hypothetical protein AABX16_00505 [Nanoarchaeota archaeon]
MNRKDYIVLKPFNIIYFKKYGVIGLIEILITIVGQSLVGASLLSGLGLLITVSPILLGMVIASLGFIQNRYLRITLLGIMTLIWLFLLFLLFV